MKLTCSILCAVVATLALSLPGCTLTKLMATRFENPTFSYAGFELVEAAQGRAIVHFLFSAHNPNEAGLKNVTCSYELYVKEKRFMTGNDIPLALDPKGDTEITVPATIEYADLTPILGSVVRWILSGRKTIPITIVADFSGRPAIMSESGKETPLSFERRLIKTVDIPLTQERKNRE